jgi:hypothetical protein
MQAVRFHRFGGPEVMAIEEIDRPIPANRPRHKLNRTPEGSPKATMLVDPTTGSATPSPALSPIPTTRPSIKNRRARTKVPRIGTSITTSAI